MFNLKKKKFLLPRLFGFRVGQSTIDPVTQLVEFISEKLDTQTLSIFMDLSKAIDHVDFGKM